jgi:hypothetical protein
MIVVAPSEAAFDKDAPLLCRAIKTVILAGRLGTRLAEDT